MALRASGLLGIRALPPEVSEATLTDLFADGSVTEVMRVRISKGKLEK